MEGTCCPWRHLPLECDAVSVLYAILEVLGVSSTSLFRPPQTPRIMLVNLPHQDWQSWKAGVRFQCSLVDLRTWQRDRRNQEVFKYTWSTSWSSRCLGFLGQQKDLPCVGFSLLGVNRQQVFSTPPSLKLRRFFQMRTCYRCQCSASAVADWHKAGNSM